MKYKISLAILLLLQTIQVWGQSGQPVVIDNAQTRIPETLIECYRNSSLRNPENLLPMTIETFIDLVRKVENFEKNTEDVASLTTSMLHMFRLDGIEKSKGVLETQGVIPYAVSGNPFFKHRLVLRYLIPSNNQKFPNESLSQVEMCSLHFMLSHTIERTQRGDEGTVCNKLANYESRRSSRIPRDARLRRQIEEEEAAESEEEPDEEEEKKSILLQLQEKTEEQNTNEDKDQMLPQEGSTDETQEETDNSSEANVHEDVHAANQTLDKDAVDIINETAVNETKSGKFIYDDFNYRINNEPVDNTPRRLIMTPKRAPSQIPASEPPPVLLPQSPSSIDSSKFKPDARVSITTTESDCPQETGVVRTRWGSVSMGSVLAGISAGLYSQQIQVQQLIFGGPRTKPLSIELSTATVDNKYATTLIGDIAEVALIQGPKGEIKIGSNGGWTNTIYPQWYLDKDGSNNEMTDAEIRGGLDGLILGTQINTWRQAVQASSGGLKLSQLLQMYYSEDGVFEDKYRACQRKDLYAEVAPMTVMKDQAYRFAVVLDQQMLKGASVENPQVQQFASAAVDKLQSYIPQMVDELCVKKQSLSSTPSSSTPQLASTNYLTAYTNITIVIDARWDYTSIRNILIYLMQELNLGEYGSRVTVLDGMKRAPFLINSIYTTDIPNNFTEASYKTHDGGMDIPKALEQELKRSMLDLLNQEDADNIAGGRSTIVLFIPKDGVSLNENDLTIAKNQMAYFREYLPDVKFLYLGTGNKENYRELVDDVNSDVFTYSYIKTENEIRSAVDPLVGRIKQVPLRLTNPNCGANWTAQSYNKAEFIHSVKQFGVNYHRLHSNYLFGVGTAELKIQSTSGGTLKVCFSRRNPYPDTSTNTSSSGNDGTECQQINGDSYTYKLSNPCEGFDYVLQCPPVYVSVSSVNKVQTYSCNDCSYPHNVKYTISNLGLGCTAGVAGFISNPLVIITAASLLFILKNLIAGR